MGVPCMPVRPYGIVIGVDAHAAIGFTPVAVPAPAPLTVWASADSAWVPQGDPYVPDVFFCGDHAMRKGADTKFVRPHLTIINVLPPPPAVTVPPGCDVGLFILVIAFGYSKPLWGPTSVKAGGKSVAVIGAPMSPGSPFNQLICSDPCDLPIGAIQEQPTSVFVGMTLGDYALCAVSMAADMALSFVLNAIGGGFENPVEPFVKAVEKEVVKDIAKYGWKKFAVAVGIESLKKYDGTQVGDRADVDEKLGFGKAKE